MNVFTSMWEITFDKYLRCCVDTACCLFAYVGSGLLRLAGYIAQLRSLTLPSSKWDKRGSLSLLFFDHFVFNSGRLERHSDSG